jgi:ribosome-binding factor A
MSTRVPRLDALLQQEISALVAREVHDPRVGFVTITRVEVSPDLRHATVWISLIGQPSERRETLRALGRAMPFVRHRLGQLRLRRIPELHLREDDTLERGTRVLHLIDELEAGKTEPSMLPPGETLPTPLLAAREPPVPRQPRASRRGGSSGQPGRADPRRGSARRS